IPMDVLVLIDKLDDLVHNAKQVPLTDQVRVDKEEIYDILDQMRATIPEEIKQARWIVKERQEMLAEAKREAERIVKAESGRQTAVGRGDDGVARAPAGEHRPLGEQEGLGEGRRDGGDLAARETVGRVVDEVGDVDAARTQDAPDGGHELGGREVARDERPV